MANFLVNGSFELPVNTQNVQVHQSGNIPGWETDTSGIEYWRSGQVNGTVFAYDGDQHVELDGAVNRFWQDVAVPFGATATRWSFAHRGRPGVGQERVGIAIGPVSINPITHPLQYTTPDALDSWTVHRGSYVIPSGTTTVRLLMRVVSSGGAVGNLVDDIQLDFDFPIGCRCPSVSQLCYRHEDQPDIIRKAIVNHSKAVPVWQDITTGALLDNDKITAVPCRAYDPLPFETVPQFIEVTHSAINTQRGARSNQWNGLEAIQPWSAALENVARQTDPDWGLPRRWPYEASANYQWTHKDTLRPLGTGYPGGTYEFEEQDFWYLFPASVIGQNVEMSALPSDGNVAVPTVYYNDGLATPGSWYEFQHIGNIGVIPNIPEYNPCLTEIGFTAVRMALACTDFYYRGGVNFRWRLQGDADWILAARDRAIPPLRRDTWEPQFQLPETFTVMRAKDGFGNVIDQAGNVIEGETCYDPPYATWPEPTITPI